MARPVSRKDSAVLRFRQRVPLDLVGKAEGRLLLVPLGTEMVEVRVGRAEVSFSLRTSDRAEAKVRQAIAASHVNDLWQRLRCGPVRLSHKQAVALAGAYYRELVAAREDSPGQPKGWEIVERIATMSVGSGLRIGVPSEPAPAHLDHTVSRLLAAHGLAVDEASKTLLVEQVRKAQADAARRLRDNANGDYGPDPAGHRFPPLEAAVPREKAERPTLTGLVEGWWRENSAANTAKPATYVNYKGAIKQLVAFLGHDDASRVTPRDVVAFKDHRLGTISERTGKPVSARTVNDTDLAALKSVLGWAVSNHKLPSNPAEGITAPVNRRAKGRKVFTADEMKVLLSACLNVERGPQESLQTYALRRWVPWVLAYTGARVGEIVQLRRQDVYRKDDHWIIHITPEAGSVKTDEEREVPVHPHLVAMGFVDFATNAPAERLFLKPEGRRATRRLPDPAVRTTSRGKRILSPPTPDETPSRDPQAVVMGRVKGAANHLREFIHGVLPSLTVQPNHAWRHTFETRCRQVGIEGYYQRVIVGHAAKDVHERYGEPAGLYREICKLPWFNVGEETEAEADASTSLARRHSAQSRAREWSP
jgi:integrase